MPTYLQALANYSLSDGEPVMSMMQPETKLQKLHLLNCIDYSGKV